jgi:hypothetical protein
MSTPSEQPDPLDPFGAWSAARDISQETWHITRDASLETLSKLMIDLVNSEVYSQATARWLDDYLTLSQPLRRVSEATMTQVLTGLNMPVRTDVTSLAERLTNVEMRLDDLDAKLDIILRAIQTPAASNLAPGATTIAPGRPANGAGRSPAKSPGRAAGKAREVR